MASELEKRYDPTAVEDKIYKNWMEKGYFRAEVDRNKEPFTIVMPPPNITGRLHMGHAIDNTIQDVLTRYKRMQGFAALWLPGTDHAAIATEAKIVENLKTKGIEKDSLTREEFLEYAWKWKEEYGGAIVEQLKKLGSSCDWSRERFTMDEGCSQAVLEVFVKLYNEGLIYRGERIINWCPTCKTSISEAEVVHTESEGSFWHINYPLSDGSGFLQLATTRPETMLGDTAVAVNPDDDRYKDLIGKMVKLPLTDREIPIIADSYVDIEFGTGVVKITPAHDPNDFEVGLRHNLPVLNIMTEDGYINEEGGEFCGLERYEARKKIVSMLEEQGLLVKIEAHTHNVGGCYRCSTVIEPRVSLQWFVHMEELAKPAIDAVENGDTNFVPDRFSKTYLNWLYGIRDWCISRQLWWGHRIPAWHCACCGEITVSKEKSVESCSKCGSSNIEQDNDTLDTWFSSALWPFSTLGWPENTDDLDFFYPTSVLVTGYDIIFFWVVRMMFSGLRQMNEVPFKTVYIHGLVRDDKGRKMSKSLGNGIDPLDVVDEYGADALRFTLTMGVSPGNDMRYSEDRVLNSRNFCNKIWNAARFIMMNLPENYEFSSLPTEGLQSSDKWVLSKLRTLTAEVTANIDNYELGMACTKLYNFIWDVFCDWYIELAKTRFNTEDSKKVCDILVYTLSESLKLLHPFMPFITEEIYKALNPNEETIMIKDYPKAESIADYSEAEQNFELIVEFIKSARNMRAELNVPPSKRVNYYITTDKTEVFATSSEYLKKLAGANEVFINEACPTDKTVSVVSRGATALIAVDELVDKEKETARLQKEKESVLKDISIISGKLTNQGFIAKAPAAVIESEQKKLAIANEKLEKLEVSLRGLLGE